MKFFEIINHKPVNIDKRGCIYKFIPDKAVKEIVTVKRKKSAVSGNHYHKGTSSSKNPEKLILLNGKAKIYLKNLKTNEEKEVIAKEGEEIHIWPYIHHTIKALEDNTLFMELK